MDHVEDLWAWSSEKVRSHKEQVEALWHSHALQVEELWSASSAGIRSRTEEVGELWARSSETFRIQTDQIWRGNIVARSEELVANITATLAVREQHLREALSQGLIVNMSEGLFERHRNLANSLKKNLTLKLKIFILVFLIFGFQRYVQTEATDISLLFFITSLVAYYLHRVSTAAEPPALFFKKSEWMTELLAHCPTLLLPYKPPILWGWNGHLQTMLLGKWGRSINPALPLVRKSIVLDDGATVYYDTFDPPFTKPKANIVIAPGVANTSEKLYIKTFTRYALMEGFRVVVLNHLGALKDIPITSPRIFGYGHTAELEAIVNIVHRRYSEPKILVGFSMGGNIAAKYMCEKPERQKMFAGMVTVCQGYDIVQSEQYMLGWHRLARFYNWTITNGALKTTIKRHGKKLYGIYDQGKVNAATCLQDIDSCMMHKMYNFKNVSEMHSQWSCSRYLNKLSIPTMMLNAVDDPIISPKVNDIPMQLAQELDKVLHVQTQCGGHLGFYTGGWLVPDGYSWMDSMIVEYCTALIALAKHSHNDDIPQLTGIPTFPVKPCCADKCVDSDHDEECCVQEIILEKNTSDREIILDNN